MKRAALMISAVVLLAAAGCGIDKEKGIFMAAGSYGDLAVVVSEPELRPAADRFLAGFVQEKTFVIKPEPTFRADVFEPDKWELAKGYKNVILLVQIGQGGDVEKAARGQVASDNWKRMTEGGGGVVQVKEPWSTYQHLVVAASRDRNNLSSLLQKNMDTIRTIFEESNRERILRRNRYEGLNTNLVNALVDRLGFFLEVPGEYVQNQLQPDGFPGVEMMRQGPSRGLSVSWLETDEPAVVLEDRDQLVALRERMGKRLHNEEILPETFQWSTAKFGDKQWLKLEGSWVSTTFDGGGAFWCYFIGDEVRGRIYCLDLLVYAPGMDKMDFFRRMEAVASTFDTKRPAR